MANFQTLGAISKGLARGTRSGLNLAQLIAARKLKEKQEASRLEEEKRQFDLIETRRQSKLFEDRQQQEVENIQRLMKDRQIREDIERTRKLETKAREREEEPINIRDAFGNLVKEGVDPRDILQKFQKEPIKKATPGEKIMAKAAEKFLTEGVSRESRPVANQILKALGIDIKFEDVPRGVLNVGGLFGPETRQVITAPQEITGGLPKATTPNQNVTQEEFLQFMKAANEDIEEARKLAAQAGFRVD